MSKPRKDCPVCGSSRSMVFEPRDTPVVYKGASRAHQATTWWCSVCGECILEPSMLAERERIFIELRAETDEIFLPERVASIRKKLGISQREASRVLGGGANAFQRYESGDVPVSDAMKNLLTLLDNDPQRLREILRARNALTSRVARAIEQPRRAAPAAKRMPDKAKRSAARDVRLSSAERSGR